jgi:serine protease Do
MRKYVLAGTVLLPFLLTFSQAAQNVTVDPSQTMIFSSEDSGAASYLGVDLADVTTDRLAVLKLKEEKGAEVNFVDSDAPAGKAGIKEHDVILSMNGTTVESAAQLRRMIKETPAGRVVTFGLSRDGQPLTLKVQLAEKNSEYALGSKMKDFHVDMPDMHFAMPDIDIPSINMVVVTQSARSGLTVENITPQLGEFFGVKNGNGVLVRAVEKGSRAEKAGFHAGDIIVKINDQMVHDTSDFTHAVHSRNGNSVSVGVVREKKEQNLNLTLPDRKDSGLLQREETSDESNNAASSYELSELQTQIARLRPEIELAMAQARKSGEEARKTYCSDQKKVLEQARKQALEQREKYRQEEETLRKEMQRMSRELRRTWAEI